jgi:Arc/MetJ-type ribon-helix-helix transcriptional regulator
MIVNNKTKRFQITLPATTVQMIDDIRQKGEFDSLSAFLNEAARRYAVRLKRATLKRALREGYQARAARDRHAVDEWDVASNELLWDNPRSSA